MMLKRSMSIRSGGSGTSEFAGDKQDDKEFVVQPGGGAGGQDHEDTEELEDNVQKQIKKQDEEQQKKQEGGQHSSIREDDHESYLEEVENFLKEMENDTNEHEKQDASQHVQQPNGNNKHRTINAMAIKSNCYNDVRISGVSRQKKLFTTIDRIQRIKNNEPQSNQAPINPNKE